VVAPNEPTCKAEQHRRLPRAGYFPREARAPPMSQIIHLLERLATAAETIADKEEAML
jgi:hypothetical protein